MHASNLLAVQPDRHGPGPSRLPVECCSSVIAGTVLGFAAYIWLLKQISPTLVSTYTFVNPLVAVTDIGRCYDLWTSRGAQFITEPKVHATELRCYMRDPDGYLIEVGQTTMTSGPLDFYV